ncbi:MAG: protein-L-isoaspartate O-methyltransferase [Micavibrio sp.]|nr:MAG: protein-L-isoaspartate O-methyltransferase [Micavibrio sp.]
MFNFEEARTNMVDGQIHTSGVVSEGVLEAFQSVPRELFVPKALQNVAYTDEDLPLGEGRFLLEPAVHAKMVQAVEPKPSDVVLDIGGGTGYSAAILSPMVTTVVAVEESQKYLNAAAKTWEELAVCNVVSFKGKLTKGSPEHAPFDLIFMNGAVSEIPGDIVAQLAMDGRLITIVKRPGETMGDVTIVQSLGEGQFSSYNLFSAGSPYLPGFAPNPTFTF